MIEGLILFGMPFLMCTDWLINNDCSSGGVLVNITSGQETLTINDPKCTNPSFDDDSTCLLYVVLNKLKLTESVYTPQLTTYPQCFLLDTRLSCCHYNANRGPDKYVNPIVSVNYCILAVQWILITAQILFI